MVVISTNNGNIWLPRLISSLEMYGPFEEKYLIVDTQSDNQEFLEYLSKLSTSSKLNIQVTRTPYRGFDTGAIVWAYREFDEPDYMFLHDTLEVKESGWLDEFKNALDGLGVVAWNLFDYSWYNDKATADFVMEKIGVNDHKSKGIFGPIFYTNRETMACMDNLGLLNAIPTRKEEAMAMELGWVAICYAANVPLLGLIPHSWSGLHNNTCRLFNKAFGGRR